MARPLNTLQMSACVFCPSCQGERGNERKHTLQGIESLEEQKGFLKAIQPARVIEALHGDTHFTLLKITV